MPRLFDCRKISISNNVGGYPVRTRVNRVENDDEECSLRVEISEAQNRLFS
jgi:hypothetical protein